MAHHRLPVGQFGVQPADVLPVGVAELRQRVDGAGVRVRPLVGVGQYGVVHGDPAALPHLPERLARLVALRHVEDAHHVVRGDHRDRAAPPGGGHRLDEDAQRPPPAREVHGVRPVGAHPVGQRGEGVGGGRVGRTVGQAQVGDLQAVARGGRRETPVQGGAVGVLLVAVLDGRHTVRALPGTVLQGPQMAHRGRRLVGVGRRHPPEAGLARPVHGVGGRGRAHHGNPGLPQGVHRLLGGPAALPEARHGDQVLVPVLHLLELVHQRLPLRRPGTAVRQQQLDLRRVAAPAALRVVQLALGQIGTLQLPAYAVAPPVAGARRHRLEVGHRHPGFAGRRHPPVLGEDLPGDVPQRGVEHVRAVGDAHALVPRPLLPHPVRTLLEHPVVHPVPAHAPVSYTHL